MSQCLVPIKFKLNVNGYQTNLTNNILRRICMIRIPDSFCD